MRTTTRLRAIAAVLAFAAWWLTPVAAAGQGWTPPRTPDGQPDIQGFWEGSGGAANAGHSLEEGCCDPEHNKMQNRAAGNIGLRQKVIVDPADGRIPYQPWAEKPLIAASLMVGSSGMSSERFSLATAKACRRPALASCWASW